MIFTLGLTMLLGFTGLSVDTANIFLQRRITQTAADAAARYAIVQLQYSLGGTNIANAACMYINANQSSGHTITLTGTSPFTGLDYLDSSGGYISSVFSGTPDCSGTCSSPPLSGCPSRSTNTVPSNASQIRATASMTFNTYFVQILGVTTYTVTGTAAFGIQTTSGYDLIALGQGCPSASAGGVTLSGNSTIDLHVGGLMVDSSCTTGDGALVTGGHADVDAGSIGVVGSYSGPPDSFTPTPAHAPYLPDPLAKVPVPSVSGSSGGNVECNSTMSLNPGVYDSITAGSNCNLTLNPGATGMWDPLESTCRHASLSIL